MHISFVGRMQVLHQVDLVHVAAADRAPHVLDGAPILAGGPRPLPFADRELLPATTRERASPQATRNEREPAGLGGRRSGVAPDRLRQAVAQVDVRAELVRVRSEESTRREPLLETAEGSGGIA
jgi:hypothetical protein